MLILFSEVQVPKHLLIPARRQIGVLLQKILFCMLLNMLIHIMVPICAEALMW